MVTVQACNINAKTYGGIKASSKATWQHRRRTPIISLMNRLSIRLSVLTMEAGAAGFVPAPDKYNPNNWGVSSVLTSNRGVPYITVDLWPRCLTTDNPLSFKHLDIFNGSSVRMLNERCSVCYFARSDVYKIFRPFPSFDKQQTVRVVNNQDEVIRYFLYSLGAR